MVGMVAIPWVLRVPAAVLVLLLAPGCGSADAMPASAEVGGGQDDAEGDSLDGRGPESSDSSDSSDTHDIADVVPLDLVAAVLGELAPLPPL